MEDKKFQKRVEDFTCAHCGTSVVGTGYTDHCPECLWSRHVDLNPGDRKSECHGLMEPMRLEGSSPHYRIVYTCTICGLEKIVNSAKEDAGDMLVRLAEKYAATL